MARSLHAIQATELEPKIAVDAHKHDSFAWKRERTFIVKFDKVLFKGALDNILKFYFWLNFIYHVKCNC